MGWSFIAPKAADLRLPVALGATLTPVAAQALEMPEAFGDDFLGIFSRGKTSLNIRPCYGIIPL